MKGKVSDVVENHGFSENSTFLHGSRFPEHSGIPLISFYPPIPILFVDHTVAALPR